MIETTPRITGLGFSVPSKIRANDDPIFDWIKKNNPHGEQLFKGYEFRHVLDDEESLIDIMLPAAKSAINDAGINASDIDILLGTGSVSEYRNPNVLSLLHKELGLKESVWVIPVDCEFSNFNASILLADSLLKTGNYKTALICVGGNWSRNVNYHTPQAISAADGAGAAVMSTSTDSTKWKLKDQLTITNTQFYGSMFSSGKEYDISPAIDNNTKFWTDTYFQITEEGINGFKTFGVNSPAEAATAILKRNNLQGSDVALISHQASSVLMDHWNDVIKPAQYINTIQRFANMAPANIPVTMAWSAQNEPVKTNHLLLLAIGPDMHTNAMLLSRDS
ncbi:MAG: 3-oxoacyl-[acyl-carrier-protein] synthase III C-terminal domain-containing protein [Daejeonella sp.]